MLARRSAIHPFAAKMSAPRRAARPFRPEFPHQRWLFAAAFLYYSAKFR